MVKNAGGNKSKRIGRKHIVAPDTKGIRYATEQGEEYAAVTKLFGGTCQVICRDGTSRICVIRKKFKGRGKRGNIISPGGWLLVGIRDWEAHSDGKPQKCDLLEVYSPTDKDHLAQTCQEDLSVLKSASIEFTDEKCDIEFTNHSSNSESDEEEHTYNVSNSVSTSLKNDETIQDTDDEINVDDI
jgi:hypothetical protein